MMLRELQAWMKLGITPQSFSPSQKTREKALENAKQRYVQRSQRSLVEYLNCWRTWIYAGLPFKVGRVDDVVKSIVGAVINGTSFNRTKEQSCVGTIKNQKSDFESPTRIKHSIIRSVDDGYNNQMKG